MPAFPYARPFLLHTVKVQMPQAQAGGCLTRAKKQLGPRSATLLSTLVQPLVCDECPIVTGWPAVLSWRALQGPKIQALPLEREARGLPKGLGVKVDRAAAGICPCHFWWI